MKNTYDDTACARVIEAAIKDAFFTALRIKDEKPAWYAKMNSRKTLLKILEFATRQPNKVIAAYCEEFDVDEETLRSSLKKKVMETLEHHGEKIS